MWPPDVASEARAWVLVAKTCGRDRSLHFRACKGNLNPIAFDVQRGQGACCDRGRLAEVAACEDGDHLTPCKNKSELCGSR